MTPAVPEARLTHDTALYNAHGTGLLGYKPLVAAIKEPTRPCKDT